MQLGEREDDVDGFAVNSKIPQDQQTHLGGSSTTRL